MSTKNTAERTPLVLIHKNLNVYGYEFDVVDNMADPNIEKSNPLAIDIFVHPTAPYDRINPSEIEKEINKNPYVLVSTELVADKYDEVFDDDNIAFFEHGKCIDHFYFPNVDEAAKYVFLKYGEKLDGLVMYHTSQREFIGNTIAKKKWGVRENGLMANQSIGILCQDGEDIYFVAGTNTYLGKFIYEYLRNSEIPYIKVIPHYNKEYDFLVDSYTLLGMNSSTEFAAININPNKVMNVLDKFEFRPVEDNP